MIKTRFTKAISSLVLCAGMAVPVAASAQTYYQHREAERVQRHHDARHHTKAKIVGGSAVGGAIIGGALGGGKGALIGAGVGAAGGLAVNHARKQHDVRRREETGRY